MTLPHDMEGARIVPTVKARQFESEKEFSAEVVKEARRRGWYVLRTWNSIHSPAGAPDLALIHPHKGKMLWRELKVGTKQRTDAQEEVHTMLRMAGQNVATWWPDDWPQIIKELS